MASELLSRRTFVDSKGGAFGEGCIFVRNGPGRVFFCFFFLFFFPNFGVTLYLPTIGEVMRRTKNDSCWTLRICIIPRTVPGLRVCKCRGGLGGYAQHLMLIWKEL